MRRESRAYVAVLAAGLALSGCSISLPSLIDTTRTGAIRAASYPFAAEDWDKASPAVISAIRAEPGDEPSAWSSDASGRRGAVVGIGARFARSGATCRAIVARIVDSSENRAVQGEACEKAGAVTLSDAGPLKGV